MRDDDRLLDIPDAEFGSGVIGVCDVCGVRQAVVILEKERFRLCVLDFLNKTWLKTDKKPSATAPLYRSDRIDFPTSATARGSAPAIVLTPTKTVRHPVVLIVPDTFGITTTLLDAGIRFAREGFEVLIPDLGKTDGIGLSHHAAITGGRAFRGGVPASSARVGRLLTLYRDALRAVLAREMVDTNRAALFGASYGGSLAVALAAESTGLTAVALAYPMPVRPAKLPNLVTVPILLVRGSQDRSSGPAERQLRESEAGAHLSVVTLAGGRHGFLSRDLRAYDLALAENAWTEIVTFLKGHLMPPPPKPPAPPSKQAAVAVTPASVGAAAPAPGRTTPPTAPASA
jgi:dienelactone hydrolase